ncbi:MAG TPA: CarD family transcriptional regulator, partial [Gemmatimonadales bacterium]|nr:CarD family transcriptional regulator [Gemmatimonadales bacterium]
MSLKPILDAFERTPAVQDLPQRLPARRAALRLGGLPGSSGAVLAAWLLQRFPQRLITIVAPSPVDAERWLTDLSHLTDAPTALYPQREALGEDEPHYEIAGERAETIQALLEGRLRVLVTTARATAERTLLPAALARLRLALAVGTRRAPGEVARSLEAMGYRRVPTVTEVAEFSIRGGILDVYGFGMAAPARLEWWGDDISSMREFDLTTQRSLGELNAITVLPVSTQAVREEADEGSAGQPVVQPVGWPNERVDNPAAISIPGPVHSDPLTARPADRRTILELLPPDTILIQEASGADLDEVSRAWNEAEHHLEVARRLGEDVPSRDAIFAPPAEWRGRIEEFPRLLLRDEQVDVQFGFFPPDRIDRDLNRLRGLLRAGTPTLILCDNEGQLERMEELLDPSVPGQSRTAALQATLAIGALDGGFVMPTLRVLTDHEIFRRARRLRRPRRYREAAPSSATGALTIGDYVVHLEHGIGIYRGIETITAGESTLEVAVVEYEGGDRLNVPLYRLDQLERYRAAGEDGDRPPPRIHRLGGTTWQRVREKTRQAIKQLAAELLELYARRTVTAGYAFPPDTKWQRELESSFLYEDTPDQRRATEEVKRDMEQPLPMDRLLVGDVGYGKTEVAVRAAFKAVQAGKQVAVLVPTTILAEQHGRTFLERLA